MPIVSHGQNSDSEKQPVGAPGNGAANSSFVVIKNARIFRGQGDSLSEPTSVLIKDDKIGAIGDTIDVPEDAMIMDAR